MHVYALGVTGYKPIALTVQPQPDLMVKEAHLPSAEDYFIKPLNRRMPVFQKPFRIVQDVTLDPSFEVAKGSDKGLKNLGNLTIAATLTYQACDDKVCFSPASVPLSWTIKVKSLDTERSRKH